MGCDLNPPVHVTLNISDPLQVAGSSQRFAIHLGTLTQECPTSEDCKIKTLEDCDLSDTSNKQSCQEE
ncbi:MAG: hypothetical protein CMH60_02395 [Myxococcales bacterium]|nr:hypothetical protein [Myxococcales bacterium]|tara:strand:+ start:1032 stop:1235 length:204 start_codon:yes stop_codon:yes gene_type:complete